MVTSANKQSGQTQSPEAAAKHNISAMISPAVTVRVRPFSHPFVCDARTALHRYGLDGLRRYDALPAADPSLDPLQETKFSFFSAYEPPNVQFVSRPYPVDEFEFGYGGAYSEYNWELFFYVPLLLATWLKRGGHYEKALSWLRAIFDPTDGDNANALDVWRFKPLRDLTSVADLQADVASASPNSAVGKWLRKRLGGSVSGEVDTSIEQQINAWMNDPFNPHLVARMRPAAYQKAVAALYVETLIAWGDKLFRRDSIEALVEAQQLYMLAQRLLGEKPQTYAAPRQATAPTPLTFSDIEAALANGETTIEQNESALPVQPSGPTVASESLASFGAGDFCVPHNDNFVKLWDTVEDRLFKLRHCMNIAGIVRQLPLFQPPIDPALLIKAKAAGLDIDSVLDQLSAPPPLHRFPILYGRALDAASYVVGLGGALLAALEKGDGERLSMLRSNHELALLTLVKDTRKAQVEEAQTALAALKLSRKITEARLQHYVELLKVGLSEREKKAQHLAAEAMMAQIGSSLLQSLGSGLNAIPQTYVGVTDAGVEFGGSHVGAVASGLAAAAGAYAGYQRDESSMASTNAGYERREQDWTLQRTLAERELTQLDKQLIGAEIRLDIANKELAAHEEQIRQSQQVNDVIETKFTNQQLYLWMAGKLSELYFRAYKLAFDTARRAERAYQAERVVPDKFFIRFGYWDGLHKGLLAGEQLQLDLRRLDAAYMESDRREYELTKSISMAEHFPAQLIALRETGVAEIELLEAHFDLDYPGHYLRRVKNVSLTLPAVTGPHSSVNCTLTLLSSKMRHDTSVSPSYAEDTAQDSRFYYHFGQVRSVCTSSGVGDAGVFEVSFRDDKLLPFEGAGAASRWRLELPQANNRFELRSLTDVVLQLQYTAREGGGALRTAAQAAASAGLLATAQRLVCIASEQAAAWDAFQTTLDASNNQVLTVSFDNMLPYVPGKGPVKMKNLYLALDLDHVDASAVALSVGVSPAGSTNPVTLVDAAAGLALVDHSAAPIDTTGASWSFTVAQDAIMATDGVSTVPPDMREETSPGSGIYRLKPSVLRDLILVLDLERDAP